MCDDVVYCILIEKIQILFYYFIHFENFNLFLNDVLISIFILPLSLRRNGKPFNLKNYINIYLDSFK